jgi:transcriptional regulator with XRE-family HTH domain
MKLKEYMKKHGLKATELAVRMGVCTSAFEHWVSGRRTPRPEHANKLVQITGGEVTLQDIYAG